MVENSNVSWSPQLQQQFKAFGEELSSIVVNELQSTLLSQRGDVEQLLEKIVLKQRDRIIRQVQKDLQQQFSLQMGSENGLYSVFLEQTLPQVFSKLGGNNVGTSIIPTFKPSQKQQFSQLGSLLQRYISRN